MGKVSSPAASWRRKWTCKFSIVSMQVLQTQQRYMAFRIFQYTVVLQQSGTDVGTGASRDSVQAKITDKLKH